MITKLVIAFLLFLLPISIHGSNIHGPIIDDNDYADFPLCGDKPLQFSRYNCYCGNRTLDADTDLHEGEYYCCVPPSSSGQDQCKQTNGLDNKYSDVRCENGEVRHKTEPCHQRCWNPYRQSEKLFKKATMYCKEEDYCIPLDQMCSGVCSEDAELCNQDNLRCIGHGYPEGDWGFSDVDNTRKSLNTKLGKDHGYCLKINNDQVYDSISRSDEQKVLGTNQPTVDYTGLVKVKDGYGDDGILCSGEYTWILEWCVGSGDVCNTTDQIISLDHPTLCRNSTYWRINSFSCYRYFGGLVRSAGGRCSGDIQHCTTPWYRYYDTSSGFTPNCVDKSDQVFPINTTCRQHNQQFLEIYRSLWCSGNTEWWHGSECDNLDDWYSKNQEDDYLRDPHGCEKSCSTAGPDCVACEHPDFFKCNSTGFCINKKNVCDHHPHPSCGGDDEGIDHCLEIYFKKRIVKRYATLICPSKMYPEMDTLAVVCDDNSECAEDRDEALCRTGADKYNPIAYAMTALMCLVYVVLKLVWFFHLQHQPVGDEEDYMEMEELASNANQEAMEIGPSSKDSI